MTKEEVIEIGFKPISHFTIGDSHTYNLGRRRQLSFSSIGTPNELLWICEVDNEENPTKITDTVCLHNYDYDGYMTVKRLKDIVRILTNRTKS